MEIQIYSCHGKSLPIKPLNPDHFFRHSLHHRPMGLPLRLARTAEIKDHSVWRFLRELYIEWPFKRKRPLFIGCDGIESRWKNTKNVLCLPGALCFQNKPGLYIEKQIGYNFPVLQESLIVLKNQWQMITDGCRRRRTTG